MPLKWTDRSSLETSNARYFIVTVLGIISVRDVSSIRPTASREGPLHPFKSYRDITMFHYNVPTEVIRATWQFTAYADGQDCPAKTVHVYLRSGSYPIVPVENVTVPGNVFANDEGTIRATTDTSSEMKITLTIPIYGPEPGDWFVGAHLSDWDERIQQQGFGYACRYILGSIAIWTQANGILDIPIGSSKTFRTIESVSYYKIYVPSGTWQFRLEISGCNFTLSALKEQRTVCLKQLALRSRSLPVPEDKSVSRNVKNLTIGESFAFVESSPYEENYYYLLVVSDSVVEFDVRVSVFECPVRNIVKPYASGYPQRALVTTSPESRGVKLRHERRHARSFVEDRDEIDPSDESKREDPCVPRHRLTRVKGLNFFSTVYLLHTRDRLTQWLSLTDIRHAHLQFDILPLLDVGGTLRIAMQLEINRELSEQRVLVRVCLRRGRASERIDGNIECGDSNMFVTLSSVENNASVIVVPFPQPGTWHLALQANCYANGPPAVACSMEEILVSLDLRTISCAFPGNDSCGTNGVCEEIHRGSTSYASCACSGGYKGWACTDSSRADSASSMLTITLLLTLSNGFFIPAIYLALKRTLYAEGLVYLATMTFSALYHACDQRFSRFCVARYEVLQYSDFFSSILAFWVTLIAMARISARLVPLFHMIGVLVISFCVEADRTGLPSVLLPVGMGTLIPIGAWIHRRWKLNERVVPREVGKLVTGIALATIGVLLFSLLETKSNYYYVHSIWHGVMASSLLFLLPNVQPEDEGCAMDEVSSENVLLDGVKDTNESLVFVTAPVRT